MLLRKLYSKYFFYRNRLQLLKFRLLGAEIHSSVISYGRFTVINPVKLSIGENCTVNEGVHFNCRDNITIGNGVRISTNAQLHTGRLILESYPRVHSHAPIVIKDNVWIATSVVVLAGVTIHENSVISAGAVITKDVPPNSVMAGVPGRVIRTLETPN